MEHKYDKLLRFYSLTLLPEGLALPKHFDKKIYFYLSDLAALFLFGFALVRCKMKLVTKASLCLGAILCFSLLSITLSPLSNYPIPYIRLLQLFTPIALFLFLASDIFDRQKLFRLFSWSFFASGIAQSCLASCQYFSQHWLGLRLLGEQPLQGALVMPGGRLWLFSNGQGDTPSLIFRAMGTLAHPNVLGGLLVLSLLLTGFLFQEQKKFRFWLAPCYLLELFALATTYSRSAIFAWILGNLIWFGWMGFKEKIWMRAPAILIASCTILIATLFSEQYVHRGGIVNYTPTARASDWERIYYQNIAFRMMQDHPITGVGFGQYSLQSPHYGADSSLISAPHNIFVLLATETGLLSLVAFVAWICILLFRRVCSLEKENALLFSAFAAYLFIGLCDFYPIGSQQGRLLFFSIAGLLAAFQNDDREDPERKILIK